MENRYCKHLLAGMIIVSILFPGNIYSAAKKKLFINNLKPKSGVSKEFAVRVRDEITLAIFEHYSSSYQIVTDDDINVMYEKTSLMMAAGSDSQSAVVQVANAVNADEIIYGSISKEGIKYRLTVQNLLRDSGSNTVSKKAFVALDFPETQTDWYCREAAKKLIDPGYKINKGKAVTKIVPRLDIDDVEVKSIRGSAIQKISYESDDQIAGRIIKDLQPIVEEGDDDFKNGSYRSALRNYRKVVRIIGKKLRKETQNKIEPFIKGILDRIGAVHTREIKDDIEDIDKYLQSEKPITIDILKKGKMKYEKILRPIFKLPAYEREGMAHVLQVIENRLTSIYLTWASIYEKEGDTQYSNYQFKKAIKYYDGGIELINKSGVKNDKMSAARATLKKKKGVVLTTGTSWLENKVISYCNAAEYLNMKNKSWKAKKYLNKAKKLIKKNEEFANDRMVYVYKDTARIIK